MVDYPKGPMLAMLAVLVVTGVVVVVRHLMS